MKNMQIVFVPSRSLNSVSRKVDDAEFGEELENHMKNMLTKMYELNGAGLAGIQVGDSRRILVADGGTGPIMMVNPEIVERSKEATSFKEGCLSLPDFQLDIERNSLIRVKYSNPLGAEQEREFSGIESVIVQHEIDHLDGITLLQKISRLKRDMYIRKINKLKRKIKRRIEQSNQVYY